MLGARPIGMRWRRHASYTAAMIRRISPYDGDGQSSMSDPTVGRNTHTVGNAPAEVIRSMAAMVFLAGSRPAIISPDTAPRGRREAQ
jgi:hypothetical protein